MTRDPRGRSHGPRALALGLSLLASGCSFRLVRPAPATDDWPNPVLPTSSQVECTDSLAPPIGDTGVTAALGTLTYVERHSGSPAVTYAIGLAAIPFLVSAIYGYIETQHCRHYQSRFNSP
jgi:hypothetical protein